MTEEVLGDGRTRNKVVDVAKGLGIIAIVIGHTHSPAHDFLYVFHVPLFIFLSGWISHSGYSFSRVVKRRLSMLYVPFVVSGLVFLAMHNLFWNLGFNGIRYSARAHLMQGLRIMAFSIGNTEPMLGALWFLKVLFMIAVAAGVLNLATKSSRLKIILCVAAVAVAAILMPYSSPQSLLRVNVIVPMLLIPFYILAAESSGWLNQWCLILSKKVWISLITLIASGLAVYGVTQISGTNDIISLKILPLPEFFVSAILGFVFVLACASLLGNWSRVGDWIMLIGKRSLWIMCLHFLAFKVAVAINAEIDSLPRSVYNDVLGVNSTVGWISCAFAGVALPMMIAAVYQKVREGKLVRI